MKTPQNTSSRGLRKIIEEIGTPSDTAEAFVVEAAKNELLVREQYTEPTTVEDAIQGNNTPDGVDLAGTLDKLIED